MMMGPSKPSLVFLFSLPTLLFFSTLPSSSSHSVSHILDSAKPHLVYGTAWKKDQTAQYVYQAILAGFRFIDTACQPKHYHEPGVGDGWTRAAQELQLARHDFYLQTKFTPYPGQDPRNVPYDPQSPLEQQIRESVRTSLTNLQTDYLDSLLLHSPLSTLDETLQAWRVLEELVDQGTVRYIGISNCYDYDFFISLVQHARIPPTTLQNRLYSDTQFDTRLRRFCRQRGIRYQSFWTLTANRDALAHPATAARAGAKGLTPQTYMFAFLMSLPGHYVTPLSGTTSLHHMAEDVAIMERLQNGERIFESEEELKEMAELLGFPEL